MNSAAMSATNTVAVRRKLYTPVFASEPDIGPAFVQAVLDNPAAADGPATFEQYSLFLECLPADRLQEPPIAAKLQQADAMVLLVHFMDTQAMDAARDLYARIAAARDVPTGVFIFRQQAERQFKISCTDCGQKLWIMEQEIGMRGRCVNCRRPMVIPMPSEYIRRRLVLPDTVPVLNVVRGDPSLCRGALANLLARTGPGIRVGTGGKPADFLKQATVPIQVGTLPTQA